LVRNGRRLSVVRFDARTGTPEAVLYRHRALSFMGSLIGPASALLTVDGTGRYVFINADDTIIGWLHNSRLRSIRTALNGVAQSVAW